MALAVVLLLLAPLAVVFGLRKAVRAQATIASGGRTALSQAWRMLLFPAIVAVTAGLALFHFGWIGGSTDFASSIGLAVRTVDNSFYTGNGVLDFFLWIALSFGNLMVYIFFFSLPYVVGSVLAVGLVLSGRGGDWTMGRPGQNEGDGS